MEPTEALRVLEVGLRRLIFEKLGEEWLSAPGAPDLGRLTKWRENEQRKRHGGVVSSNLLDYTMTSDLRDIILQNWGVFESVFPDQERFATLFNMVEDVRNTVAHSKDLLPWERDMLSGIARYISNLLAEDRSGSEGDASHYPRIEFMMDHQGNQAVVADAYGQRQAVTGKTLAVGEHVSLSLRSTPTRGRDLLWLVYVGPGPMVAGNGNIPQRLSGPEVRFEYVIQEKDVSPELQVVAILASDSKFHRFGATFGFPVHDDFRSISYPVAPPYGL